jgi:hypothetical protein
MTLFSFENLYRHYLGCRRNKRNTINALRFESQQELGRPMLFQQQRERTRYEVSG